MAIDANALRAELGNAPAQNVPDSVLDNCITVADEELKVYAGTTYRTDGVIPVPVAEKALLAVAVEIFNQRRAPNGYLTQQFATPDGAVGGAVRIGTDPLRPAYGLLERWVIGTSFA